MKFSKVQRTSAVMLAVTALITGCGGGSELANGPDQVVATEVRFAPQHKEMLQLASDEKIGRQAYALTASLGKYGGALREAGWAFNAVSAPTEIPNDAKSLVYINASDASANAEALAPFMADFKGVVIVDSNWVQDDDWLEKLKQTAPSPDNAATSALAPTATFFYGKLNRKSIGAPNATALVYSVQERKIMPISMDDEGLINGMAAQKFTEAIDLQVKVAGNVAAQRDDGTRVGKQGALDATSDGNVEIYGEKDGWIAAGQIVYWAWRNLDGKKYVYAEVRAGDNLSTCLVANSYNCGVYPKNQDSIIKTTSSTGHRDTISYATSYQASLQTKEGVSVKSYAPSAEAWKKPEAIASDSTEVKWSEGTSVGTSEVATSRRNAVGVFTLDGAGGVYTKITQHNKRYQSWAGASNHGTNSDGKMFFWSGIGLLAERNIVDVAWPGANDSGQDAGSQFEKDFRGEQLAGKTNICGWDNNNNIKPRSSWEGWNPTVAGMFEVKSTVGGLFNLYSWVTFEGSLRWKRAKHGWDRITTSNNNTYWMHLNPEKTGYVPCESIYAPPVASYSVTTSFTIWDVVVGDPDAGNFNLVK